MIVRFMFLTLLSFCSFASALQNPEIDDIMQMWEEEDSRKKATEIMYVIETSISHESKHDVLKWKKIADHIRKLVDHFNHSNDSEDMSDETFSDDIGRTVQVLKDARSLVKGDNAFHIAVSAFNNEETHMNQALYHEGIEVNLTFEVSEKTSVDNQKKIKQLISDFSKLCKDTDAALDKKNKFAY